ncbi:MAG: AAA family ATPase [Spirochaetes bacterium]|nr:AAA family ATPase [Spirochaetota bacterium]
MADTVNPWLPLAEDDTIWPAANKAQREEWLRVFAAGAVAIPHTAEAESAALRQRTLAGRNYLVPHRHLPWLDFLLRKEPGSRGATQDEALEILRQGQHLLLTGGPGTGKSHTISAFVRDLKPINARPPRVAIAAPTGKAAARFKHLESSTHALVESSTLHRLLGISRDERRLTYNALHPLPCDILIIDEISMLDLFLFSATLRALPPGAQLLLAGDLEQLPAVDGLPIDEAIRFISERQIMSHVHLTQVQRFSAEKAHAYRLLAAKGFAALEEPAVAGVIDRVRISNANALQVYTDAYAEEYLNGKDARMLREAFARIQETSDLTAALAEQAFGFLRARVLLCERREGVFGALAISRRIATAALRFSQGIGRTLEPVMNTFNDYDLQIYNGDVGFLWETQGRRRVVFQTPEGGFRIVEADRLRGAETAYAMTIHKSQGSEYEDVFIINESGAAADARLLYTAVTRARNKATILEVVK